MDEMSEIARQYLEQPWCEDSSHWHLDPVPISACESGPVMNKRKTVFDILVKYFADDPELGLTARDQALMLTDALIAESAEIWRRNHEGDA